MHEEGVFVQQDGTPFFMEGRPMRVQTIQLISQVNPTSVVGKILQFPVVRMLTVALFILPFLVVHNTVIGDGIASTAEPLHSILVDVDAAVSVCVILLLYALYVRCVEKRKAYEVSLGGGLWEAGRGVLLAGGIIGTTVLPMALLGHYEVASTEPAGALVHGLFFFAIGALIQELGFRLILFRLLEELTGTWLGLVLVAVVFALFHAANPDATAATLLAMGVGDLLLGACFVYTRRIWLVWGFHAGWNYLQDGVLGMPNSGITELVSWISPNVSGPEWLTGGVFGIEASWVVLLASAVVATWMLAWSRIEGQIVPPVWRRE
jgi:uncharacterized protein